MSVCRCIHVCVGVYLYACVLGVCVWRVCVFVSMHAFVVVGYCMCVSTYICIFMHIVLYRVGLLFYEYQNGQHQDWRVLFLH